MMAEKKNTARKTKVQQEAHPAKALYRIVAQETDRDSRPCPRRLPRQDASSRPGRGSSVTSWCARPWSAEEQLIRDQGGTSRPSRKRLCDSCCEGNRRDSHSRPSASSRPGTEPCDKKLIVTGQPARDSHQDQARVKPSRKSPVTAVVKVNRSSHSSREARSQSQGPEEGEKPDR